MTTGTELVTKLCEQWPTMARESPEEMAALFSDDAVYQNMPWPGDVIGGPAIAAQLALPDSWGSVRCNVVHVIEEGGVVCSERLEIFQPRDIEPFDLPVVGVFQVRDGKITAWRDYFDPTPLRPLLGQR